MMNGQLLLVSHPESVKASEAYSNAIKSELEASRLGPALSAMALAPSVANASALNNALDTVYSRHNLIRRGSHFSPIRSKQGFAEVIYGIGAALDNLDQAIKPSSVDIEAAWKEQAKIATLFNEVSRYAIEHRAFVASEHRRELERFAETCATLNVLSLGALVTGVMMMLSLFLRRLNVSRSEDGYELV